MPTSNPIIPGFNPDPSICRVGDSYFLATSSFEFFPGVPIYHSVDLVNWSLIGHALNRPSQLYMRTVPPGGGVFAPTLRHHKGRFYMATTCFQRRGDPYIAPRGFVVYTDDIFDETKWSEPIHFDNLGIDQDLFFDDDDRVYLGTARRTPITNPITRLVTYYSEIDITSGRNLTPPVILRESSEANDIAEGPHIFKRQGWYYLLTAEGGTELDHQEWIFRSRSPLGPYEEPPAGANPIVFNGLHDQVRQTGHMDMIEGADGRWWAVLLATRPQSDSKGLIPSQLGRETFLAPVEWSSDGWPTINNGRPISLSVEANSLPQSPTASDWRDDFETASLSPGWYHIRTPMRQEYSLTAKPGHLTIYGNAYAIHDQESPATVLRKQRAFSGCWSTELEFSPSMENQEAGTCVYWSNWAYAAILLRRGRNGTRELVVRWTDDVEDRTKETTRPAPASGPVNLVIEASPTSYTFRIGDEIVQMIPSTAIVTKRPGDTPCTGTHFGLFAQGVDGNPCSEPAYFGYASWTPSCP